MKKIVLAGVCAAFCALGGFASWTFDETKMTVTDGSWVFPVTGTRDALTLGKASARGGATLLDLTTGIAGGGAFVGLGERCIQYGSDSAQTNLKEVRLPDTLTSIGMAAFAYCSVLTNVTPFLSATVTNLGVSAFCGCTKLRGNLVLSNPKLVLGGSDNYQYATFYQSGIDSADLSGAEGLTSTPLGFLRETPNLKWVKYPSTLTQLGGGSHYGCKSLADVSLLSFPTFGSDCFGGGKAMPYARITYPSTNGGWLNYFNNNTDKKTWANAGTSNQNTYNASFKDGYTPIGYAKMASSTLSSYNYASYFWLVPVSAASEVSIYIDGNPKVCTVSPAYGDKGTVSTFPYVCSAPEYGEDGNIVYRCTGYRIGRPSGTTIVYGDLVAERTCSFAKPDENGIYYIQWQWEKAACRVGVSNFPSAFGTVTVSGEELSGYSGCYLYNQPVTLTATAADGTPFVRWFGSVTAANRTDNPLTLTVDAPKTVIPYFAAKWTYDESAGSVTNVTDGYWTIRVAGGTREAIALSQPTANGGITVLDLRKEIDGGGAFVSLADHFMHWYLPESIRSTITEVHLPESMTTISAGAFWNCTTLEKAVISTRTESIRELAFGNCTALVSVEPFLPASVTYLGPEAFTGTASLKIPLELNLTNCFTVGLDSHGSMRGAFYNSGIASVDMSESVITNICTGAFRASKNLATVNFPPNLVTVGHASFYGCSSLKAVALPDSTDTFDTFAFYGCTSLKSFTPFVPAKLKELGKGTFANCGSLRGDLVVSGQTVISGDRSDTTDSESNLYGSGIDNADFSADRKMTFVPRAFMRECKNLKSVKYPKTLTDFGGAAHYGCTSLKDIQFRSYPTNLTSTLGDAFGQTYAYGRIVYPKGDAGWRQYLDEHTNDNFTAWDPDSAKAKEYLARFPDGWKPIGYMTVGKGTTYGANVKWMVPHSFDSGTAIFIR